MNIYSERVFEDSHILGQAIPRPLQKRLPHEVGIWNDLYKPRGEEMAGYRSADCSHTYGFGMGGSRRGGNGHK